jgi:hypothetical protein
MRQHSLPISGLDPRQIFAAPSAAEAAMQGRQALNPVFITNHNLLKNSFKNQLTI